MTPVARPDAVIGQRLRALRIAAGIAQKDLAGICCVTPPAIFDIESGRRRPSPPLAREIFSALSVPDELRRDACLVWGAEILETAREWANTAGIEPAFAIMAKRPVLQ